MEPSAKIPVARRSSVIRAKPFLRAAKRVGASQNLLCDLPGLGLPGLRLPETVSPRQRFSLHRDPVYRPQMGREHQPQAPSRPSTKVVEKHEKAFSQRSGASSASAAETS